MKKLRFFIALDLKSNTQNINIVRKLYRHVYGFKVGYRSFYNNLSKELISEIKKSKCKLFLDLKLHDIPNTVRSAIDSLSIINPDFLTLHISGGNEMMKAAVKSIKKNKLKTKILGVTLLTSLDGKDSKKIYQESNTKKLVKKFTDIANNVNIHGLICSGDDLRVLGKYNKLIKITPGVKMFERNDDQKRVTFAHNALQNGASFVVIGRELIESKRPLDLLKKYGEQHKNKNLWTK
jgi:orotidine-5'-phosphate decarboxylase